MSYYSIQIIIKEIFETGDLTSLNYYERKNKGLKFKILNDEKMITFQNTIEKKILKSGLDFYCLKSKKRLVKYRADQKIRMNVKEINLDVFNVSFSNFLLLIKPFYIERLSFYFKLLIQF